MSDQQPSSRTIDVRGRNPVTSAIAAVIILAICIVPIWVMVYVSSHDRAPEVPIDDWFGWPQPAQTSD